MRLRNEGCHEPAVSLYSRQRLSFGEAARGLTEVPDHLRGAFADAPYRAAERVFDAAIKERVDFVALAGDLIDPPLAGPRGLVFLGEQFARLAEKDIKVYWAGGRSDNFERWAEAWPLGVNVLRFPLNRVQRITHERGGQPLVQILGTSSGQRRKIRAADFHADGSELFSVAVAHGSADPDVLARQAVELLGSGRRARPPSAAERPDRGALLGQSSGPPAARVRPARLHAGAGGRRLADSHQFHSHRCRPLSTRADRGR